MYRIRATALLLLAMTSAGAPATTVYKSVDANGIVRFSDRPPATDTSVVEVIQLAVPPAVSVPDSQQLIAAMAATTERLREDRLRRSEERSPKPSPVLPAAEQHYSEPTQVWYYPGPYRHGYQGEAWHRHHGRRHPQREPDTRTERDRRRDDMSGPWFIPRQLPGATGPSPGR